MAGKTHPSDWRNASPLTKRLALLAVIGVTVGVFSVTHFSAAAAKTVGPTLIARNAAGETLLANGSTLFLVDTRETHTLSFPAAELGVRGPVMSVSTDGKDWYLGDDATGMLYRCDLPARRCVAALQTQPGVRIFRRAHHVAFTIDRIFMTDSEAHRVLGFTRDGMATGSTRTTPLALCFPNDLVASGEDLYVADTNNFRIARLAAGARAHSTTVLRTHVGAPIERANCNARSAAALKRGTPVLNTVIDSSNTESREARPPARPDRVWPASVLRTSTGEWWVIQMANRMRMGDVIRYDADGQPSGRVALPPDADPIELVEGRDGILITDAGLTRVHRVSLQGQLLGSWGPPDLQGRLHAIAAERDEQRNLQYLSYGLIGLGAFAALAVVVAELRRKRAERWSAHGVLRPVSAHPAPLGHETVWITLEAEVLKRARRVLWVLAAYTIVASGVLVYLARDVRVETPTGRLQAIATCTTIFVFLLIAAYATFNVDRMAQRRIGVTRGHLRYDPGSGSVTESPWEDVRVSSNGMLIGRHLVQIVDPRGRFMFPQAEVESHMLSRLQPGAFLSNARLLLEALRRGNVTLWVTTVGLASYLAFMLLEWLQPAVTDRLGAQIAELLHRAW
jgi:hypothetical protein